MKSKFFCIIISIATLLPTIPVYSQNSWITEIPDDTQSIEMIRSADSCFIVLGYPNFTNSKINLTKVSRSGEIVWNKTYESDTGNFSNLNLLQLTNGNYFIAGKRNWKPYAAMFDQFGDSIWTKRYDGYSIEGCFYNPIEVNDNEVWVSGGYDTLYVTKINQVGNLHVDSTLITIRPFMRLYHNNNLIFQTGDLMTCVSNFYLTDTNLNITAHKSCRFNVVSSVKVRQHDDKYYFYGYSNATYPVTNGFLVLNSELDSIAYIPDSIYYPLGTWQMTADINDFVFTNDNRIAMCGQVYYFWEYHPLFIVTDPDFQPEIIYAYLDVVPQAGVNLLQEGDGYVMLQHRYDDMNFKRSFVVKTNPDGSSGSETATIERNFLRVYPNPFQDEINISIAGNENIESVSIYDLSGRLVYFRSNIHDGRIVQIDGSLLPPGCYVACIQTGSKKSSTYVKITRN